MATAPAATTPAPAAAPAAAAAAARGSLHSRWLLGSGGVAALLVLAGALGFLAYERRELTEQATEHGALYARVLEDHANRTFDAIDLAMAATLQTVRLQRAEGDGRNLTPTLQAAIQTLPFLRSISVMDAQGRVVASSVPGNVGLQLRREQLLPPPATGGLGPLQNGRDLADLASGSPRAPQGQGAHFVPLLMRAEAGPGTDWLVATLNPGYFGNQYALMLDGTPLRAWLVSYGGQLLVPPTGARRAAGDWLQEHPVFAEALAAGRESGLARGSGVEGEPVFLAWRTARRQPLVVLVETPEAGPAAVLQAMSLRVALGALGLLAGLGVVTWLAWRSLRAQEAVQSDLRAVRGSLAAQDAFTDRLFQVSPIPMTVKDVHGRFLRVNEAWSGLTGIQPAQALGRTLGNLYPPQLAAPHEVQEQMAIASMQLQRYEEQILDSDGLPRDVVLQVMPYADAGGQVAGVISCLMDVTEFREVAQRTLEAKEAAERANAAKTEFLANISHELRTPLQSILGFSELGRSRSRADARLQSMFGTIHDAGNRMLVLVNNLLDLSRLESPVGEVQRRPQDIVPALRQVADELQGLAQTRGLQLASPPADAPALWVLGDAFRLQQVLRNVLANALRFAPAGSTVELAWQAEPGGEHCVTVRDHGPGIPEAELETIFESFVQSSRTKDGSGGTGLGLAICRKIMDAHGGGIRAHNHPEGGAVFSITLPAMAESEVAAARAMLQAATPAAV